MQGPVDVSRIGGLQAGTRSQSTSENGLGFCEVWSRVMCMKGISRPLSEFPWRVQLGGGEDAELMRNQDGGQRIFSSACVITELHFTE